MNKNLSSIQVLVTYIVELSAALILAAAVAVWLALRTAIRKARVQQIPLFSTSELI